MPLQIYKMMSKHQYPLSQAEVQMYRYAMLAF